MDFYQLIPPQVLGIAALIGTYCLILAYQKQHEIKNVLTKGIKTIGTVVQIQYEPSGNGGGAPIVEFTYPNGSYRHHSVTYMQPCPYQVGQSVEIWYLFYKSNRLAALADEQPGNLPRIFWITGIVLCLLSYPAIAMRMMMLT